MAPRKTTARKTTTRRRTTKKDEIPEVCDHSMENAKRLECMSGRVDAIGNNLKVIKENDLRHIGDDIALLKEDSKETKEKIQELREDQVEIRTDLKHIIGNADKNFKWIFWLVTALGSGAIGLLFAFIKGFI